MSVKISIALAAYNGDAFLKQQLESFLSQSLLPNEIVITDDGSSDDTLKIIREFRSKAPFPVICSQNVKTLGYP